ncbi:MAG: hypothetical protein IJ184_04470 [Alphaproteobacteria bacterium]|nr:hypothetical protein [Alphaproteobacteria bacterium]
MANLSRQKIERFKQAVAEYRDFGGKEVSPELLAEASHEEIMAFLQKHLLGARPWADAQEDNHRKDIRQVIWEDVMQTKSGVLNEDCQVAILRRGDIREIKALIKSMPLCPLAQMAIICAGEAELKQCLFENQILSAVALNALLNKECDVADVKMWLKTPISVVQRRENAMLSYALVRFLPDEELCEYLEQNTLWGEQAQIELIERGCEKAVRIFIKNQMLESNALLTLIDSDMHDVLLEYVKKRDLPDEAVEAIFDGKLEDAALLYISRIEDLSDEMEVKLIDAQMPNVLESYLERSDYGCYEFSSGTEAYFMRYGAKEAVMTYLGRALLSDDGFLALVERGDDEALQWYIKQQSYTLISEMQECSLVQNCSHRIVMEYLQYAELFDISELALVEKGNSEEIITYLKRQCPQNRLVIVDLLERGIKEEIDVLLSRYYPEIVIGD